MTKLEQDLTQSIHETLDAAAQRNELRVAWIRAINLTIVAGIGFGIMSQATLWLSIGWAACAWMILAVESRKKYRLSRR